MKDPRTKLLTTLLIAVWLLSSSCGQQPEPQAAKMDNPAPATVDSAPVRQALISGNMKYLYIHKDSLLNMSNKDKKKITFEFYFGPLDTLTLKGWSNDKVSNDFNTDPDFPLTMGLSTTVTYSPSFYLGDLVIYKSQLKTINDLLTSNSKMNFIVFMPKQLGPEGGHVTYDILLYDVLPPGSLTPDQYLKTAVTTGVTTNPSPPKNSIGS